MAGEAGAGAVYGASAVVGECSGVFRPGGVAGEAGAGVVHGASAVVDLWGMLTGGSVTVG
ncbi:hypothetical protein ABZX62_02230 [Streptomyces flavidovirens]|uniref:Uncharacterized protein n=1 Tax=Streptomyces flavidovirens TaxID=67298 RepID=A0ABW6REL5_9ACTN